MNQQIPFELDSLQYAYNYQKWMTDAIEPELGNSILEIGAGIGNLSSRLPLRSKLIFTESDPYLYEMLKTKVKDKFSENTQVKTFLVDIATNWTEPLLTENIDTVVSFNVLEHIEDDFAAMKQIYHLLKNGGSLNEKKIITFVPAHQWAFGEMDKKFKHFRRYNHKRLIEIANKIDPKIQIEYRYFNLLGLPPWFFFGRILRRNKIDKSSITIFEKICPYIRGIDDFIHSVLRLPFGQSLIFTMKFR
mgnify:CR=1 FL=1|tara:strand:- start:75933 stop:76673 length:741 start_codon:yes stop_codon:yes gene_type:complete